MLDVILLGRICMKMQYNADGSAEIVQAVEADSHVEFGNPVLKPKASTLWTSLSSISLASPLRY